MQDLNLVIENIQEQVGEPAAGGNSNLFLIILIILPIGLIIFFIMKKKKDNNTKSKVVPKHEKDEVWQTIKRYLKENNETGKEVIDVFTLKRPNPFDKSTMNKQQRIQAKIEERELANLKKTNPEEYKKKKAEQSIQKKRKPKEIYVVWFVTKNTKTQEVDPPRIIECEVVVKKIDRSKTERNIKINGLMDFEKEMQWIKPIKDKEDALYQKQINKKAKRNKKHNKEEK